MQMYITYTAWQSNDWDAATENAGPSYMGGKCETSSYGTKVASKVKHVIVHW